MQALIDLLQVLEGGSSLRSHSWGWSACIEQVDGEGDTRQVWLCRTYSGYSSKHFHALLANYFTCISGILDIEYEDHHDGHQVRRLYPGESMLVLPREDHRLIVVEPGYFTETYFPGNNAVTAIDWDDIVRLDEGSSEDWRP